MPSAELSDENGARGGTDMLRVANPRSGATSIARLRSAGLRPGSVRSSEVGRDARLPSAPLDSVASGASPITPVRLPLCSIRSGLRQMLRIKRASTSDVASGVSLITLILSPPDSIRAGLRQMLLGMCRRRMGQAAGRNRCTPVFNPQPVRSVELCSPRSITLRTLPGRRPALQPSNARRSAPGKTHFCCPLHPRSRIVPAELLSSHEEFTTAPRHLRPPVPLRPDHPRRGTYARYLLGRCRRRRRHTHRHPGRRIGAGVGTGAGACYRVTRPSGRLRIAIPPRFGRHRTRDRPLAESCSKINHWQGAVGWLRCGRWLDSPRSGGVVVCGRFGGPCTSQHQRRWICWPAWGNCSHGHVILGQSSSSTPQARS